MNTFEDYLRETEYKTMVIPEPVKKFYAYKNGVATEFQTRNDAAAHSKLVDHVVVNQAEIDEAVDKQRAEYQKAFSNWMNEFRSEYDDLSQKEFDIIYSAAYDMNHSSGYTDVYYKFDELYSMYMKLKKANK